jgi:hemin uptake protein HemP
MTKDNPDDGTQKPERKRADHLNEIDVRQLLGKEREAVLIHAGERYRLRITASGKLLLTK